MYRMFDKKRQIIELVRNPQFRPWSAAARPDGFPDRIRIHFGYGADAAVRAVERGKADLASIGFKNSLGVRTEVYIRHRGLVHSYPILDVQGALLNPLTPPFNDRRVRQAFNDAVDRRHVVALAGADLATSTCQFLPPNLAGYRRYCPYMRGGNVGGEYAGPDLAMARRLVAASRTHGKKVVFRVADPKQPTPIERYLASVLNGLGYRVRFAAGDATLRDQMVVNGWAIDYPDTSAMLLPIVGCRSASNTFSFCEARIDREMARAVALEINRPQAAARLWAKVDRDVTDEAPWVPYLNQRSVDIVSARTGNYVFTAQGAAGPLYDQLWVR
jgi:peptide/nickel transport system substrate-binding protein